MESPILSLVHVKAVMDVSFVLSDINILDNSFLVDITTIPGAIMFPVLARISTECPELNSKDTVVRVLPSIEQVIFLCARTGRYKGPGGSIITKTYSISVIIKDCARTFY